MCIEIAAASVSNGAAVQLNTCNQGVAQQFKVQLKSGESCVHRMQVMGSAFFSC